MAAAAAGLGLRGRLHALLPRDKPPLRGHHLPILFSQLLLGGWARLRPPREAAALRHRSLDAASVASAGTQCQRAGQAAGMPVARGHRGQGTARKRSCSRRPAR